MHILLLLVGLSFSSPVRWSVQVTDPRFELKHFTLPDREYKAFLPKTSWRCWFGPTQKKEGGLEIKSIRCSYSIRKSGRFTTWVSCHPKEPYGESKLELYDERKKLTFQILVSCRRS